MSILRVVLDIFHLRKSAQRKSITPANAHLIRSTNRKVFMRLEDPDVLLPAMDDKPKDRQ